MGNKIVKIVKRLFDYPIKRKPICFFRQEDFSSTGEPLPKEEINQHGPLSEYDKLVQSFYARLLEQRRAHMEEEEKNETAEGKAASKFSGWDEMTISNLHSLFLLFDKNLNGMLNYDDFSAVLESLGDESSNDYRKQRFDEIDLDMDGWITYDEFLEVIYNFHPQDGESLTGLAKLCSEIAENIKFLPYGGSIWPTGFLNILPLQLFGTTLGYQLAKMYIPVMKARIHLSKVSMQQT